MNYFVEGIQGSGKSTLVQRLENKYPQYRTYKEGEYTPIELAWCAYVDSDTYEEILKKFPEMEEAVKQNTIREYDQRRRAFDYYIHKDTNRKRPVLPGAREV